VAKFREDTSIYPLLINLASCLCQEVDEIHGPSLCYCGVLTGPLTLDFCGGDCAEGACGGQAWVRLVEGFPSSTFPSADSNLTNCGSPWAYQVEIGIARCAPQGESSGVNGYSPPTMEANVRALRQQTADLAAMRRAITCCFGSGDLDYIVGGYAQVDVSGGGCLGGAINIYVREEF